MVLLSSQSFAEDTEENDSNEGASEENSNEISESADQSESPSNEVSEATSPPVQRASKLKETEYWFKVSYESE